MRAYQQMSLILDNQANLGLSFDSGSDTKQFFSFQDLVRTPATPMFGMSSMFAIDDALVTTSTTKKLGPAFPCLEQAPEARVDLFSKDDNVLDTLKPLVDLDTLFSDDTDVQHSSPIDAGQLYSPALPETVDPMSNSGEVLPVMFEWFDRRPLRAIHSDEEFIPGEDINTGESDASPTNQHKRQRLAYRGLVRKIDHKEVPSMRGHTPEPLADKSMDLRAPQVLTPLAKDEPSSDALEEFKKALAKRSLSRFQEKFISDPEFRNSEPLSKRFTAFCPAVGCEERFPDEGHLAFHCDNHERNELTKRRYCEHEYCPRKSIGFASLSSLIRHNLSVHGEPKYRCNRCDVRFTRLDYLRKHQFRDNACEPAPSGS